MRVLFPFSLVEFSVLNEWRLFNSDGRDVAEEIRLFNIPSFIGWEIDNDEYLKKFEQLLESLKAERC